MTIVPGCENFQELGPTTSVLIIDSLGAVLFSTEEERKKESQKVRSDCTIDSIIELVHITYLFVNVLMMETAFFIKMVIMPTSFLCRLEVPL